MKEKFLQRRKFYRVLNGDGTTHQGFKNSTKAGGVTEAPDWDSNPRINCGRGLHVVEGHPFVAFEIISREDPIFFEVETDPNPPVMSIGGGKFRCKKVTNKRRLTKRSPEFRPKLLAQIAEKDHNCNVRIAAVERLDPEKYSKLLAQIAEKDGNWHVHLAAVTKLES